MERSEFSEKFSAAFEDLLSVLRMEAEQHGYVLSWMESGLLSPLDCRDSSDEDTDLIIQDAEERM